MKLDDFICASNLLSIINNFSFVLSPQSVAFLRVFTFCCFVFASAATRLLWLAACTRLFWAVDIRLGNHIEMPLVWVRADRLRLTKGLGHARR